MPGFARLLTLILSAGFAVSAAPDKNDAPSTFLEQSAGSPVKWKRWSAETLDAARAANTPLYIHIGSATDGLARAMRKESFSRPETARTLNEHFTSILIDRLAEPAVAAHFAAAAERQLGRSGWPLNIWATPDGMPFEIARYLPPSDEWGGRGLPAMIDAMVERWENSRDQTIAAAKQFAEDYSFGKEDINQASAADLLASALESSEDTAPEAASGLPAIELRTLARLAASPMPQAKAFGERFETELDRVLDSSLQDHIGGGFFSGYATEEAVLPTFRKLLVDQALMIELLATAKSTRYRREVLERAVAGLLRDFSAPGGGFLAAWDSVPADTSANPPPPEGSYYLVRLADLQAILIPVAADVISAQYGLAPGGNINPDSEAFEQYRKLNLFRRVLPDREVNVAHKLRPDSLAQIRARSFTQLALFRQNQQPRPARDASRIVEWNALTVQALAAASRALGREDLVRIARETFAHVRSALEAAHPARLIGLTGDDAPSASLADHAAAGLAAMELLGGAKEEALRAFAVARADLLTANLEHGIVMQSVPLVAEALPAIKDDRSPSATAMTLELLDRLAAAGEKQMPETAARMRQSVHPLASENPETAMGYLANIVGR